MCDPVNLTQNMNVRVCYGCVFDKMQRDHRAAGNIFAQGKELYEVSPYEWNEVMHSDIDSFLKGRLEVVAHEMALCGLHHGPVPDCRRPSIDGAVIEGPAANVWEGKDLR